MVGKFIVIRLPESIAATLAEKPHLCGDRPTFPEQKAESEAACPGAGLHQSGMQKGCSGCFQLRA